MRPATWSRIAGQTNFGYKKILNRDTYYTQGDNSNVNDSQTNQECIDNLGSKSLKGLKIILDFTNWESKVRQWLFYRFFFQQDERKRV